MKKCKVCGKNSVGEYCFSHKPRKDLRKSKGLKMSTGIYQQMRERPATNLKRTNEKIDKEAMKLMFIALWQTMSIPRMSQVSGTYLGKEFSSIFFHHILPKSKYPQGMLDVENIVILTGDEHTNVENDMYKYEEINRRRSYLKVKYNL